MGRHRLGLVCWALLWAIWVCAQLGGQALLAADALGFLLGAAGILTTGVAIGWYGPRWWRLRPR